MWRPSWTRALVVVSLVVSTALALAALAPPAEALRLGCPSTNANGCSLSDIACSGHNCCCLYAGLSCPEESRTIGPCFLTGPF